MPGLFTTLVLAAMSFRCVEAIPIAAQPPVAEATGTAFVRSEAAPHRHQQRRFRMEVGPTGSILSADGDALGSPLGQLEDTAEDSLENSDNASHHLGSLLTVRSDAGVKNFVPIDHVVAIWNPEAERFARMANYQGSCTDGPSGWADRNGVTCAQYVSKQWCTPSRGYGASWSTGTFNDVASNGKSAVQACCGCGGGTTKVPAEPSFRLKVKTVSKAGGDWVKVDCPAGHKVIGGGCNAKGRPWHLKFNGPSGDASWWCGGHGGTKTAWAICTTALTPSITKKEGKNWVTVECPAGEKILGGGCQAKLAPFKASYNGPVGNHKWKCGGMGGDKNAWAICTGEVTAKIETVSKNGKWVSARCKGGKKIIGGGCQTHGSGAQGLQYNGPSGTTKWKCGAHGAKKKVWALCADLDDGKSTPRDEYELDVSTKMNIIKLPYDWHWERFLVVDMGGNDVGFYSKIHGRFIRIKANGEAVSTSPKVATQVPLGSTTGQWAEASFTPIDAGGGDVAFYCKASKRFLRMEKDTRGCDAADHGCHEWRMKGSSTKESNSALDKWEKFKLLDMGYENRDRLYPAIYAKVDDISELNREVAVLRAKADKELELLDVSDKHPLGSLLAARAAGEVKMYLPFGHTIALFCPERRRFMNMQQASMGVSPQRRDTLFQPSWLWERFLLVDAGGSDVALYSTAHGRFVRMTDKGTLVAGAKVAADKLTANMKWERFKAVDGLGGTIGFYHEDHHRFISMRAKTTGSGVEMGGSALIMKKPLDLPAHWMNERFKIIDLGYHRANEKFPYDNIFTRVRRERLEELQREVRQLDSELNGAVVLLRDRGIGALSAINSHLNHTTDLGGADHVEDAGKDTYAD